jgi:hypothetical protein
VAAGWVHVLVYVAHADVDLAELGAEHLKGWGGQVRTVDRSAVSMSGQ